MVVKKQLYLAHDLPTLTKKADVLQKDSSNGQNFNALQRALTMLMKKANEEFETGDEERAFLLYMRYADQAECLQNKPSLSHNEKSTLFKNRQQAISRCESLKKSLEERYEQARIEEKLLSCPKPPQSVPVVPLVGNDISDASKNRQIPITPMIPVPPATSTIAVGGDNKNPEPPKTLNNEPLKVNSTAVTDLQVQKGPCFVTSAELRDLILKRQALILDVRAAEAFADSHINITTDIINIPKLYAGIPAHSIEEKLSGKEKELFKRRKNFQTIVVVDWEGQDPIVPYSKPYCVSEALKKWVPSEDMITCVHLKFGYKLWTSAFPHDTTNPKPDLLLNSEGGDASSNHADNVRRLSWLPEEFAKAVNVVPTPTVAPIVAPRISEVPRKPSKPVTASDKDVVSTESNPPAPAKELKPQSVPVSKPREATPTVPPPIKNDCSEITKIDKTSQDTIKQFTKAVNEKISVQKPRTFSEAEGSTPEYRHPKATLMRSRSMGDIYEESAHRDSFSRVLENNVEARKPSFDRSLKPTQSLEAATVHQPVDVPQVVNNNNRNNHNHSVARDNGSIKHPGTIVPSLRREKARPPIPPKNRRSQSPVQAYFYGTIDRTAGLRNLRNTCYLNSVVQALAHSTEFAHYFVRRDHLLHIQDPKRESLATLFARLLALLWSQTDTREVLTLFREQIGARVPMYRSSDQQDSHEFLMSLLTVLHEDLNEAAKSNSQTPCDDPDLVVTFEMLPTKLNEFYIAHQERQASIVTRNFEGVLLSGLKCLTCEKDSYTFQVFTVLSVPVPSSWPQLDLQACFDQFFKEETVEEWHCPHCKKKRSATKQMKIARLPKHLIIHLIRFKNEPWISSLASIKKVNNKVHFTEDLDTRDFAQYVYSKNVQLMSYTLYGIVKHHGTLSNGHYIAECRFLGKQAQPWYCYNDQEVTPLRNTIDVDNAYMLFYSCVKNS